MNTHLYRARDDRMLAGVAGGLADLWDADPSLVRIIWALLVPLTGGIALVVYIVMAIVVPEEDGSRSWASQAPAWDARTGSPSSAPAGGAPAPTAETASVTDAAGLSPAQPASAAATIPASSGPSATDWQASRFEARDMRRAARHEARAARRASRGYDGRSGAVVVGVLFILVGAWSLVRQYLPEIDWDWFWPLVLVGVGVLVLVLAVRPRSDPSKPADANGGSTRS